MGTGCHRQVNAVLGNLLRLHYPGEIPTSGGQRIPTKSWKDYTLATDLTYGNAQGAVWNDF